MWIKKVLHNELKNGVSGLSHYDPNTITRFISHTHTLILTHTLSISLVFTHTLSLLLHTHSYTYSHTHPLDVSLRSISNNFLLTHTHKRTHTRTQSGVGWMRERECVGIMANMARPSRFRIGPHRLRIFTVKVHSANGGNEVLLENERSLSLSFYSLSLSLLTHTLTHSYTHILIHSYTHVHAHNTHAHNAHAHVHKQSAWEREYGTHRLWTLSLPLLSLPLPLSSPLSSILSSLLPLPLSLPHTHSLSMRPPLRVIRFSISLIGRHMF